MSGLIAPTGAISIILTFTAFDTEARFDILTVESCTTHSCAQRTTLLSAHSGPEFPGPIVSNTGFMLIRLVSEQSVTDFGWSAAWSSLGLSTAGTF